MKRWERQAEWDEIRQGNAYSMESVACVEGCTQTQLYDATYRPLSEAREVIGRGNKNQCVDICGQHKKEHA